MLLEWLRFCAICGFMFPPVRWLCDHCWADLKNRYLPYSQTYRVQKKFAHLRLLDWKDDSPPLRSFFLSLKGEAPKEVWNELAKESFARFSNTKAWSFFKNPIFVPAPARDPLKKDHARLFAEALASYFGGSVHLALNYGSDSSSQKSKTRLERSKKVFHSSENLENTNVIFVDDILTTGFTAQAAYNALGCPKKFLICTLAWRPPPATIDSQ